MAGGHSTKQSLAELPTWWCRGPAGPQRAGQRQMGQEPQWEVCSVLMGTGDVLEVGESKGETLTAASVLLGGEGVGSGEGRVMGITAWSIQGVMVAFPLNP